MPSLTHGIRSSPIVELWSVVWGAHESLCGGNGVSFVESEAATALPRTAQKTVTLHGCQATWFALRKAESGPDPAVFVVCDFVVGVAASWTVAKHERIVRPPHVYLLPASGPYLIRHNEVFVLSGTRRRAIISRPMVGGGVGRET